MAGDHIVAPWRHGKYRRQPARNLADLRPE